MRTTLIFPAALAALSPLAGAQSFEAYEYLGEPGDQAGFAVADVGDVDGDGFADHAVGSPGHDAGASTDIGRVRVHSGRTGALLREHLGQEPYDAFGYSVDGVGDLDGDGCSEYVVGAPKADFAGALDGGKAYLYSGKTGALLTQVAFAENYARLGQAVCGTGDLNGDGVPDWAVTSPWLDASGGGPNNVGRVQVFDGASGGSLWYREGPLPGGAFGFSIDVVGDLNGDGVNELVVGAPDEDVIASDIGRGYVLDGASGATLFSRLGFWANGKLGYDVAGVGDVNGDGVPDVGFGAPYGDTNGASSGSVVVVSGKAPYPALGEIAGPAGARTGDSLCGLGDADGDGRDDFAVGMPGADLFGLKSLGWVYLVSGATLTPFTTLIGEDEFGLFGQALDGLGDLNGDGFGDLIAGAPYDGDGGKVRVLLGEFPMPDVYCTAKINSQGCLPGIDWQGVPSFSIGGGFSITADKIVSDVVGVLIWSQAPGSTPFGGGTLCLSGNVTRTSGQFSGSQQGAPCTGSFAFQFGPAYMLAQGLGAGADVYAQYWSRDPGFVAPNNINLTDALHFEVRP